MTCDVTSVGLLNHVQRQSNAAWVRLNDIYRPLIGNWLRKLGVSQADADDVSQDVLVIVCRRLPAFERQRRGSFRCWLRCITVNCLRDYRRKSSRHVAGESVSNVLQSLEDPQSRLSRRWNVEHDMHVLRHVMKELKGEFTAQTWQAFEQTALAGRRQGDVAQELGMTANAVCIAKSRVSARIRAAAKDLL